MKTTIDIHRFDKRLEFARRTLLRKEVSDRNRELIERFEQYAVLARANGVPRRAKILDVLGRWAVRLGKDFDQVTVDELKRAVMQYEDRRELSGETKRTEKVILRLFYGWLVYGDRAFTVKEHPPIVSWMSIRIPPNQRPKIERQDILTFDEVARLLEAAHGTRDRALLAVLYETGARIGELGNSRLCDVVETPDGFRIHLSGKTGTRDRLLLDSVPRLVAWLNEHPWRADPEAPLWPLPDGRPCPYSALRALLQRTAERAGLGAKRVYPHLFRHTRATHLLLTGRINETQAKVYFGWSPSSNMISRYAHLVTDDVDNVYRSLHGIQVPAREADRQTALPCSICKAMNRRDSLRCWRCGRSTQELAPIALQESNAESWNVTRLLLDDPEVQALVARKLRELGAQDVQLS